MISAFLRCNLIRYYRNQFIVVFIFAGFSENRFPRRKINTCCGASFSLEIRVIFKFYNWNLYAIYLENVQRFLLLCCSVDLIYIWFCFLLVEGAAGARVVLTSGIFPDEEVWIPLKYHLILLRLFKFYINLINSRRGGGV